jgi:hypothetical protein
MVFVFGLWFKKNKGWKIGRLGPYHSYHNGSAHSKRNDGKSIGDQLNHQQTIDDDKKYSSVSVPFFAFSLQSLQFNLQ